MERIWLKSYPAGVPADIDPSGYGSLADFFAASVARFRDRTAYVSMGRAMSYGELDRLSLAFGGYLQTAAGLKRGARIALMMPNLLQYPIALFGALRAGYVIVNCNPLYSPRELHHQLADSGAEAIVVLENFASTLQKAIDGTAIRAVVVTGVGDCLGPVRGALTNFVVRRIRRAVPPWTLPQAVSFRSALALGGRARAELPPIDPKDIAFLQYTGGTTGVPKGAMLTHRNMVANLQQVAAWIAPVVGTGETFVTALPLYHVFALTVNCFVPLMVGSNNLLIPNPRDIRAFVKALRRAPFTEISGVNTLFNVLLDDPEFLRLDFSRLHLAVAGGMAVQRAVAERWKQATGKALVEGYGLTETSPIATINPLDLENYNGSIGLPMPSTDIAIRDMNGRDVALGDPGELCIKGPQVMAGYWMKPDETANVMTADGYLRTGDIARVDENGFVTIVDRQKDMILVSGFNVYPNEIEDVVMMHPGIREVGAVGVPDAKSGEAVKIVVVRKDDSVTKDDLIAHCRERLTGYKTPRHVEFRDQLPRTPIGKILRRELKETAERKEAPEPDAEAAKESADIRSA
jgi:long-chain acyl-CoA synthetase